ncbi:MAG TPA: ABC transporter ATP-binding protein [Bryobacterales bacterium]|nr:ABC transporter ATP-binding protein [Bryobacterales bacterium]
MSDPAVSSQSHGDENTPGRKPARIADIGLIARLVTYLSPYRPAVALSILLLIVHSLLGVAGPYLTKVAVDRYLLAEAASSPLDAWLPPDPRAGLDFLAFLYIATLLIGFAARYFQTYVMHYTGQRVMRDLRLEIFDHLQTMETRFFDRNQVGRLVTRVTSDVDALNEMFTSGVVAVFGDVLTLVAVFLAMLYLSPELTLAVVVLTPLVLVVVFVFRKYARAAYRSVRQAVATTNTFLQEHISGMKVVQLFAHERESLKEFDEISAAHRDAHRQAIRAHACFYPVIEWLGVLGSGILLFYGGYLVSEGALTVGVVVAFLQYGTRVFRPIQDLSEKYNILQSAMASCERIFGLLDTKPQQEEAGEPAVLSADAVERPPSAARGVGADASAGGSPLRVEFRNVWFAYQHEEWVLRDVSFTIEPGETLAVVGRTGSGKTTLINLLLRFYQLRKGDILVAGKSVREWPADELRRQFGVVLQEPYLFSGSIEDNIRMHDRTISSEAVREVAKEVNLAPFIESLPDGYQTKLNEQGSSLSWGQRQLVSFARALAHRPRLLILDEATSSVDTQTEIQIRDAVPRLMKGHTSIVIAHRLSTIKHADRILVMHKGEIRELGTHDELLRLGGVYAKLYQLQYQEQETRQWQPADEGRTAAEDSV